MTEIVDVAIIGAGPYGLSLAAHLAGQGVNFRIFGNPMHTWRSSMPEGMVLKSEGNASDLYDPDGEMTLGRFCKDAGLHAWLPFHQLREGWVAACPAHRQMQCGVAEQAALPPACTLATSG